MGSYLKIQGNFKAPFLMQVRLCDKRTVDKWTFGNVSFHMVTIGSVLVHWQVQQKGFNCLKGFQVFFKPEKQKRWQEVSQGYHIPWHSFHHTANASQSVYGDYKVKANEIFNSKHNRFSPVFRLRPPEAKRARQGGI